MLQKSPMYAYLPARDLDRARRFYEGTLGFVPKSLNNGGVVYEFAENTACFMYATPNAGTSRASQAFWQVDDIEREVGELKKRGVSFEDYAVPGTKTRDGISVEGGVKAGKKLMDSVKLCTLAENLGSVETLITHPVTMTHAVVEPAERLRVGITDGLVRLSVGIEDVEDLIADLREALDRL